MNSFTPHVQNEIRLAIQEAVQEQLQDVTPDNLSVRVMSSALEFSPLHPQGMKINVRMEIQVNPRDKKEAPS